MSTAYDAILSDFHGALAAARAIVSAFSEPALPPRHRVAAVNSAVLLVCANFEEFVREMAREYAREVVERCGSIDRVPRRITETAWKRTLSSLAKHGLSRSRPGLADALADAETRFRIVHAFCAGDLSMDIYGDLIYNESNMKIAQINELFAICSLPNVCREICNRPTLQEALGEVDGGRANGLLVMSIDGLMDRRNEIAHGINQGSSSSGDEFSRFVELLTAFSKALFEILTINTQSTSRTPSAEEVVVQSP